MPLSLRPGIRVLSRLHASIDSLLEKFDGTMQTGCDIGAGNMQEFSRLPGRETRVDAQLDHLTIGAGKKRDHFSQQSEQFLFDREFFRVPARIFRFREWGFTAPLALAADIPGGIGNNLADPRTRLRTIEIRMVDRLQDLDPTDLKSVFGQTVFPRDSSGQRKEAVGTAGDPFFFVALDEGAPPLILFESRVGQNMQALGHFVTLYPVPDSSPMTETKASDQKPRRQAGPRIEPGSLRLTGSPG